MRPVKLTVRSKERGHGPCRSREGRLRATSLAAPADLADDLAGRRVDALAVHEARRRVGALRAAEEQDVRLRPVDRVVHPAAALLHAEAAPLGLGEKAALGRVLRDVLGQDDVAARGERRGERRACEQPQQSR